MIDDIKNDYYWSTAQEKLMSFSKPHLNGECLRDVFYNVSEC